MKVTKLTHIFGSDCYHFKLTLEGFVIQGFLYNARTRSIRPPHTGSAKGYILPCVWAHGKKWNELRDLLDFMLDKGLTTCYTSQMNNALIKAAKTKAEDNHGL